MLIFFLCLIQLNKIHYNTLKKIIHFIKPPEILYFDILFYILKIVTRYYFDFNYNIACILKNYYTANLRISL